MSEDATALWDPNRLSLITNLFTEFITRSNEPIREYSWRPVAIAVDRHGSVVWECGRKHEVTNLNVALTLALSEGEDGGYPLDAWVTIDNNERFKRIPLVSTTLTATEPLTLAEIMSRLFAAAEDAGARTTEADLNESYLVPRAPHQGAMITRT